MGVSFARTSIPAALSAATYDAANALTKWDSNRSFKYDGNGNTTADGTYSYTWNGRLHAGAGRPIGRNRSLRSARYSGNDSTATR